VDDNNQSVTQSPMHTEMLKLWIQGNTKKGSSPAKIVAALVNHSYAPKASEAEAFLSVKHDYTSLQAAQTGITTLAVSLVQERMETEIARAADKKAGLHTFTTGGKEIEADDFGAEAIQEVISVFKRHMPLTWHLLMMLASPLKMKDAEYDDDVPPTMVDKLGRPIVRRNPQLVVAQALSALVYSKNKYAKLLALHKAMLNTKSGDMSA
jgi:hypothetical protein